MTQLQTESLRTLLSKLAPIDDELPPDEFDPAVVVGDIRDKVDAIKWQIDDWNYKAKMIEEQWIKQLKAKTDSLKKKAEKLKDYTRSQMIEHGFDKLPGNAVRAQLQKKAPKVLTDYEPLFTHFKAHPEYVRQVVTYEWQKKEIQQALTNGKELNFARLDNAKSLRFWAQDTAQISGESDE